MAKFPPARKLKSLTTRTKTQPSFWGGGGPSDRRQSAVLNFHQLLNMKWTLLSAFACALLFTTGCLSSREEWRGHADNALFGGIPPGPQAVVVWAPVRSMRPADIIVR